MVDVIDRYTETAQRRSRPREPSRWKKGDIVTFFHDGKAVKGEIIGLNEDGTVNVTYWRGIFSGGLGRAIKRKMYHVTPYTLLSRHGEMKT